jgi:hypothetical protein
MCDSTSYTAHPTDTISEPYTLGNHRKEIRANSSFEVLPPVGRKPVTMTSKYEVT